MDILKNYNNIYLNHARSKCWIERPQLTEDSQVGILNVGKVNKDLKIENKTDKEEEEEEEDDTGKYFYE